MEFTEAPEYEDDVEDNDGGGGEYGSDAGTPGLDGTSDFVFAFVGANNGISGVSGSGREF